jgi:hypothetical protein
MPPVSLIELPYKPVTRRLRPTDGLVMRPRKSRRHRGIREAVQFGEFDRTAPERKQTAEMHDEPIPPLIVPVEPGATSAYLRFRMKEPGLRTKSRQSSITLFCR